MDFVSRQQLAPLRDNPLCHLVAVTRLSLIVPYELSSAITASSSFVNFTISKPLVFT